MGGSSLLLCPLWMLEEKARRRPIRDPDPRTIFAKETMMELLINQTGEILSTIGMQFKHANNKISIGILYNFSSN